MKTGSEVVPKVSSEKTWSSAFVVSDFVCIVGSGSFHLLDQGLVPEKLADMRDRPPNKSVVRE